MIEISKRCWQLILLVGIATSGYAQMQNPIQRLETRAKLAKVESPTTIDDLAAEVVNFHHVYKIPTFIETALESDLSRAETAYRNHLGPGVSEAELLVTANTLTDKLKLPAYARTTAAQIRTLRMGLALTSPSFMGSGIASHDMKVGDSIHPAMSPLQAAHLLGVLIDQKVLNPDFQDPNLDVAALFQQRLNRRQAGQTNGSPTAPRVVHNPSQHSGEMRTAIASATRSMSETEAATLLNQILSSLHLK